MARVPKVGQCSRWMIVHHSLGTGLHIVSHIPTTVWLVVASGCGRGTEKLLTTIKVQTSASVLVKGVLCGVLLTNAHSVQKRLIRKILPLPAAQKFLSLFLSSQKQLGTPLRLKSDTTSNSCRRTWRSYCSAASHPTRSCDACWHQGRSWRQSHRAEAAQQQVGRSCCGTLVLVDT
jgi:hypothetical protein